MKGPLRDLLEKKRKNKFRESESLEIEIIVVRERSKERINYVSADDAFEIFLNPVPLS